MGDNKLVKSGTNYRTNTNTGTKCVLCNGEARTYCESDDATLCWDCDSRVHSANFLVARHSRALLCRSCHRPTAWKASGERLPPTVSLCPQCCFETESESNDDNDEAEECETEETQDEEEEEEEEMEMEEEEGDNQVVPWGMIDPPGVSDGSSSDGSTSKTNGMDQSDLRQMRRRSHVIKRGTVFLACKNKDEIIRDESRNGFLANKSRGLFFESTNHLHFRIYSLVMARAYWVNIIFNTRCIVLIGRTVILIQSFDGF